MATTPTLAGRSVGLCRLAASALIAGVFRRMTVKDVNDRLARKSLTEQALVLGGVLLFLFLSALLAAQFGIFGMLAYFLALVVIVN